MATEHLQSSLAGALSRRGLLKGAAGITAAQSFATGAQQTQLTSSSSPIFAYVGTYTGAIGAGGNGQGIYLYAMYPSTGRLSLIKVVSQVPNPSSLALHPSRKYLYAVNEVANFNGANGSVSSFAVNQANGDLQFLNVVSSEGGGPAHLSVHPSGKFVFAANYGGGSIAVLPVLPNGSLGPAVDTRKDIDSLGPKEATSGPPGSFAISGHEAPHAHMIESDRSGKFVLTTDLAQDRIYVYGFDTTSGKLADLDYISVPPGDGPRHFYFHPNNRWLYSIQEEASTLIFFEFDDATGSLIAQQTISSLPRRFTGTNFTSEIMIDSGGRFLYASNRLHDTIGVFSIDNGGGLTHLGESSTMGDYPRQFNIDPTGKFMYVCNQRSDVVTAFQIDQGDGSLRFTGQYTPVGSPSCIIFLA